MTYWLFKSEPQTFSINHLAKAPQQITAWEGVRNYQARNMLRDQCKVGDGVLFYHSSCATPGIAGTAKIVRAGYPDATQFDEKSQYYDAKSMPTAPRWYVVDIQLEDVFSTIIALSTLRRYPQLQAMGVLQRGSRLSITPVTIQEWKFIQQLAREVTHV